MAVLRGNDRLNIDLIGSIVDEDGIENENENENGNGTCRCVVWRD